MANDGMSFYERLFDEKKIKKKQFSLCLGWNLTVSKGGIHSGFMTLGGRNAALYNNYMVYAKNIVAKGPYTVYVQKMYLKKGSISTSNVENATLEINASQNDLNSGKGVILDSGSTDIYFSASIFESFKQKWRELTSLEFKKVDISLTEINLNKYPTILIQLKGIDNKNIVQGEKQALLAGNLDPLNPFDVIFEIPPTHYMEKRPNSAGYMNRLHFNEASGIILGASAMRGHDIHFDLENNRIGFAESSCNYQDLIKEKNTAFIEAEKSISQFYSKPTSVKIVEKQKDNDVDCKISEPILEIPCWKSISEKDCLNKSPSQTVNGHATYSAYLLSPCNDNNLDFAKSLVTDIVLVQCFFQPYCNIETKCQTTCREVIEATKFRKQILGITSNVMESLSFFTRTFAFLIILGFFVLICMLFGECDAIKSISLSSFFLLVRFDSMKLFLIALFYFSHHFLHVTIIKLIIEYF